MGIWHCQVLASEILETTVLSNPIASLQAEEWCVIIENGASLDWRSLERRRPDRNAGAHNDTVRFLVKSETRAAHSFLWSQRCNAQHWRAL